MLSKEDLIKLRKEIVLNSIFLNDYSNTFGIRKEKVYNFFEGYLSYLYEIKEEKDGFSLVYPDDVIDALDNEDNLYNWYLCFIEDPLDNMDSEIDALVKDFCKDNEIDVYADYRDYEDIEYLLYKEKTTPYGSSYKVKVNKDEFIDNIMYGYDDTLSYYEDEFISNFKDTIKEDTELLEYIDSVEGYSYLLDCIRSYCVVNYPIEDFLKREIKINIFYSEKNKSGYDDIFYPFLMHSQGYKCKDYTYIKKMLNNLNEYNTPLYSGISEKTKEKIKADRKNNKFINSLLQEIENCYFQSPKDLCVIASVTIDDYFNLLEKNKKFTISKNCTIGLVDIYNGGGSILEIQLEKDIVFNTNDIYIKVEGVDDYTVDNIYGLSSSCFSDCVRI